MPDLKDRASKGGLFEPELVFFGIFSRANGKSFVFFEITLGNLAPLFYKTANPGISADAAIPRTLEKAKTRTCNPAASNAFDFLVSSRMLLLDS